MFSVSYDKLRAADLAVIAALDRQYLDSSMTDDAVAVHHRQSRSKHGTIIAEIKPPIYLAVAT